jgi:hypothetical protein
MVKVGEISVKTGLKSGEIEIVELESNLIKISILAGRGADLVEFIYKPKNINLAWQSSTGWPTKKTPFNHPADVASFLDGYPGGWQSIFPNGGAPSTYKGIEFAQHDEVSMLEWQYEILTGNENEISVKFETKTQKLNFIYEKIFTLRNGEPTLFLDENIKNLSNEETKTMWGTHITFGEPFLDQFSTIEVENGAIARPHDQAISSIGRRLGSVLDFNWPISQGESGEIVDFSKIPPRGTKSEIIYIFNFDTAKYSVNSPTSGLKVEVSWDKSNLPYLWYWQEFGGSNEYPWYGKHFNIGLEPFSSYPTNGLADAVSNGSALFFNGYEEKTNHLEFKVLEL